MYKKLIHVSVKCGSWYLVASRDIDPKTDRATKSKIGGYIIYKDNRTCIFYTNHLSKTPPKYVIEVTHKDSIECVHVLGEMHRFDRTKHKVTKTVYNVHNITVAYNKYMNNVDLVDQRRKTSYTQRKEKKFYMIF